MYNTQLLSVSILNRTSLRVLSQFFSIIELPSHHLCFSITLISFVKALDHFATHPRYQTFSESKANHFWNDLFIENIFSGILDKLFYRVTIAVGQLT